MEKTKYFSTAFRTFILLYFLTIRLSTGTKVNPPSSSIHPNSHHHTHPHIPHHYQNHVNNDPSLLQNGHISHNNIHSQQQPHQVSVISHSIPVDQSQNTHNYPVAVSQFSQHGLDQPITFTQQSSILPQPQFYSAHPQPLIPEAHQQNCTTSQSHTHESSTKPTSISTSSTSPTSKTTSGSSSTTPMSKRQPHHLPFFMKKVNKIANKFSIFFDNLFHGHQHYEGGRGWYPQQHQPSNQFRPPPPPPSNQNQRPYYPYPNQQYYPNSRSDYDYYGSCKFGPCKSVKHALDSFFFKDGFGKLIHKLHHHHH